MQFKVSEEFVREAHKAACSDWKTKIEKEFPELFKTKLEVGKWYIFKKHNLNWLMNYQGGGIGYGFNTARIWSKDYNMKYETDWKEATPEEVEAALIAEARKRGYKAGVIIIPVNEYTTKLTISSDIFKTTERGGLNVFNNDGSIQFEQNTYACLYASGKWATILPEEKTIITKGKALRIIAKKLKVSPESIEIQ